MERRGRSEIVTTGPDARLSELVSRIRGVLDRGDSPSEMHRKAALRRLLHEHAAGLNREEIEDLVTNLRDRFPDRIFESDRSARGLASRAEGYEQELAVLRAENDRLRARVKHVDELMARLARAAETRSGQARDTTAGPVTRRALEPAAETTLVEVAALLFAFAANQEEMVHSIEETLGGRAGRASSENLTRVFPELTSGKAVTAEDLEAIRRRLRSIQLMPGALLSGVQQSWKGGTQALLEELAPKLDKANILKAHIVLRELEQRFDEFWNNLDRNIEHFYRGRFERAYRDKMEEGP
jgi:hypothetical protein